MVCQDEEVLASRALLALALPSLAGVLREGGQVLEESQLLVFVPGMKAQEVREKIQALFGEDKVILKKYFETMVCLIAIKKQRKIRKKSLKKNQTHFTTITSKSGGEFLIKYVIRACFRHGYKQ